jgi:hypothetical protein
MMGMISRRQTTALVEQAVGMLSQEWVVTSKQTVRFGNLAIRVRNSVTGEAEQFVIFRAHPDYDSFAALEVGHSVRFHAHDRPHPHLGAGDLGSFVSLARPVLHAMDL